MRPFFEALQNLDITEAQSFLSDPQALYTLMDRPSPEERKAAARALELAPADKLSGLLRQPYFLDTLSYGHNAGALDSKRMLACALRCKNQDLAAVCFDLAFGADLRIGNGYESGAYAAGLSGQELADLMRLPSMLSPDRLLHPNLLQSLGASFTKFAQASARAGASCCAAARDACMKLPGPAEAWIRCACSACLNDPDALRSYCPSPDELRRLCEAAAAFEGCDPLAMASKAGNAELARQILACGAACDPNKPFASPGSETSSAWLFAFSHASPELAEILSRAGGDADDPALPEAVLKGSFPLAHPLAQSALALALRNVERGSACAAALLPLAMDRARLRTCGAEAREFCDRLIAQGRGGPGPASVDKIAETALAKAIADLPDFRQQMPEGPIRPSDAPALFRAACAKFDEAGRQSHVMASLRKALLCLDLSAIGPDAADECLSMLFCVPGRERMPLAEAALLNPTFPLAQALPETATQALLAAVRADRILPIKMLALSGFDPFSLEDGMLTVFETALQERASSPIAFDYLNILRQADACPSPRPPKRRPAAP